MSKMMKEYITKQGFEPGATCGDPSCHICGYLCDSCLTPHGYVEYLEKEVARLRYMRRAAIERAYTFPGLKPDDLAHLDQV